MINRIPGDFKLFYIVLCNGAWIIKDNQLIHRDEICAADVKRICNELSRAGYYPMIEANDTFFSDDKEKSWLEGKIFPFSEYNCIDACKILAFRADGIDETGVDRIIAGNFTKVITDRGTLLQISKKGCTKVSACEVILQREGIDWKDTIAFGDDTNDLPIFKGRYPIAMGNVSEELKFEAKWITEQTMKRVGMAIDRFILNKVPSGSEAV